MKMKKLNINKEERLQAINKLSLLIQDTQLKSLKEIRSLAEDIEILSNTQLLKNLNKGIDDIEKGNYMTFEEFRKSLNTSKGK